MQAGRNVGQPREAERVVVEYNAATEEVIRRVTAQRYSENGTRSLGQAWGIRGFANSTFPNFLDNLPLDSVVPWCVRCSQHFGFSWLHDRDFDAPLVPMRPADTSAAMTVWMGHLLKRILSHQGQCSSLNFWHVEGIDPPHRRMIKLRCP